MSLTNTTLSSSIRIYWYSHKYYKHIPKYNTFKPLLSYTATVTQLTYNHLKDQHTQCPVVHRQVVSLVQNDLRGQVVGGTAQGPGLARQQLLRQAEINQFYIPLGVHYLDKEGIYISIVEIIRKSYRYYINIYIRKIS